MFLSLHHDMAQWTQQDWVDFWDMVSGICQVIIVVLTLTTAIVAIYQLRMRRIEARPQIDLHLEKGKYDEIRISLLNVKSTPVYIKDYLIYWLIPFESHFRKRETFFPTHMLETETISELPRGKKVLNTGETFELSIQKHFFSYFIGCIQGLIKLTEKEKSEMERVIKVIPFLNKELISSQQSYELMLLFDIPGVIPKPRVYIYLERVIDENYIIWVHTKRFVKNGSPSFFVRKRFPPKIKGEFVIPMCMLLKYQDILDYCKEINERRELEVQIEKKLREITHHNICD